MLKDNFRLKIKDYSRGTKGKEDKDWDARKNVGTTIYPHQSVEESKSDEI